LLDEATLRATEDASTDRDVTAQVVVGSTVNVRGKFATHALVTE